MVKPKRKDNFIFYDAEWQFPAITEEHAWKKAQEILPDVEGIVYFAFPWATFIDLLMRMKKESNRLYEILKYALTMINPGERVVTVCQHILMLKCQNIFINSGITDIFWSHAIKNQMSFPKHPNINIHPFPLYPVQAINEQIDPNIDKPILYSFIGARPNNWYLTNSRNLILDLLINDKRGKIITRNAWHFRTVVYRYQINKESLSNNELIDNTATEEYKHTLKNSIFSLCPSGSGPNSIRIWESIGYGAIPVILSDSYLPPGDQNLWNEAVIFCDETADAIKLLPDYLENMAKDNEFLERKRNAMRQIWKLYGPDYFIYDIHKFYLNLDGKYKENSINSQ